MTSVEITAWITAIIMLIGAAVWVATVVRGIRQYRRLSREFDIVHARVSREISEGIAGDWQRVGNDLRKAIKAGQL